MPEPIVLHLGFDHVAEVVQAADAEDGEAENGKADDGEEETQSVEAAEAADEAFEAKAENDAESLQDCIYNILRSCFESTQRIDWQIK